MKKYEPGKIEGKWQKVWDKSGIYSAKDFSKKPKFYSLIEFPYPSADGLHVGHIRSNTAMDIISRKRRMEGYNVLYPVGWDAFGLPTENFAIKTGIHPIKITKKNTDTFRRQLKAGGFSFDWKREVNTSDPEYYRWTQWIFLQLFKKGLAYKQKTFVNWCPKDKTGLANEEVVNGCCERCGTPVEKKEKEQWMLRITKYADRLIDDLDQTDYLDIIKTQQKNWIGRSEGSEIDFKIKIGSGVIPAQAGIQTRVNSNLDSRLRGNDTNTEAQITVFTTRADTLFGVTYVVLAPEHPLVADLKEQASNKQEIEAYIQKTLLETDTDRTAEGREKTGVKLEGVRAINPASGVSVPVFIADYVLASYGTGAVMAVPAHDERDFAFAKKYNLPIKQVIAPKFVQPDNPPRDGKNTRRRPTVHVILEHPTQKKVLLLQWKGAEWEGKEKRTFIIGGIEAGEELAEAGRREIQEESGYKNVEFVKDLGLEVHTQYFAAHKDENRQADIRIAHFKLLNEEKETVADEENHKHDPVWIDFNKVGEFLNVVDAPLIWDYFMNGQKAFTDEGVLINSGKFNDLDSVEAIKEITKFVKGQTVVKYKLRDWVFSRQRYWGEPIPLVFCEHCAKTQIGADKTRINADRKAVLSEGERLNPGWYAVPEKDLPVKLPVVKDFQPSDDGESPLIRAEKWLQTECPACGGPARRETDTMPNWAGSSWYFLRYIDPKNKKIFADGKKLQYWGQVNWYNGGMEHVTLHLLYSRFWNKFLFDLGVVPFSEPYIKRTAHGMILGEGGVKMSKSKGNVINPDSVVKSYGADTLRLYEMFMGPFDQAIAWSTESIIGSRRFLDRVWNLSAKVTKKAKLDEETEILLNQTVKKVGDDIEVMGFNTAISTMMILTNRLDTLTAVPVPAWEMFLKIFSPFAPHITEELWAQLGHKKSIHLEAWPKYDSKKLINQTVNIAVQINGKVRSAFAIKIGATEAEVKKIALALPDVSKWLVGKEIRKVIYVPNKILNLVIV